MNAEVIVKDIWTEVLVGGQDEEERGSGSAAFQGASVVNIGMDEYLPHPASHPRHF